MAVVVGANLFSTLNSSPSFHWNSSKVSGKFKIRPVSALFTESTKDTNSKIRKLDEKAETGGRRRISEALDESKIQRMSIKDYLERSKDLIRSDGGPPRWFSPLECGGVRLKDSPLLLYLPGIVLVFWNFKNSFTD